MHRAGRRWTGRAIERRAAGIGRHRQRGIRQHGRNRRRGLFQLNDEPAEVQRNHPAHAGRLERRGGGGVAPERHHFPRIRRRLGEDQSPDPAGHVGAPGLGRPGARLSPTIQPHGGNAHWRRTKAESREVCAARVIAPESRTLSLATMHSERRVGGGAGLGGGGAGGGETTGHDQERGKRPPRPSQGRTIGVVGHGRNLSADGGRPGAAPENWSRDLATTNGLPPMRLLIRLTAVWASSRVAKVPARTL